MARGLWRAVFQREQVGQVADTAAGPCRADLGMAKPQSNTHNLSLTLASKRYWEEMGTLSLPPEPNPPLVPPRSQVGLGHANACFIYLNNTLEDIKTIVFSAPLLGMVYGFPLIFQFFEINICRAWKPIYFPPKCLSSGSFGFVFSIWLLFSISTHPAPASCFLETSHPRLSLPWLCS